MVDRKPNLFIVGAPRCGTSALQHFLDHHPEIFMPTIKEPHYFSSDITEEGDRYRGRPASWAFRTPEQYLWLYRPATNQKYLGDASVLHLYSKVAAENIASFNPDARIIAMIREPIAFLHSLHARYLYHLDEDCESFVAALDLEASRKAGNNLPRTVRVPSLLYYSELAAFSEQLQRYRRLFPESQIKVVVFDDLKSDTEQVYRDVLEFLGVDDTTVRPPERANRNRNRLPRSKLLAMVLRGLIPHVAHPHKEPGFPRELGMKAPWLSRILPAKAYATLYRLLDRVNMRVVPPSKLDPETRASLVERFKPEVQRLSDLLDRDLVRLWHYD